MACIASALPAPPGTRLGATNASDRARDDDAEPGTDDRGPSRLPGTRARRGDARAALLFALAALALGGCGRGGSEGGRAGPPPVAVQIATAAPRTLPRTIASVGSLESPSTATVASEIPGRIVALDVPEGRRVEKGHVLARLDDAEARAAVRIATARLTNARYRLRRLENLRAESVSSEQAYEDALSGFEAAEGAWQEATTRLEKTTIRAPFAGALGLRRVDDGEYVDAGTAIVDVTRTDPLDLVFSIPQRFAGELRTGQTVTGAAGRCGPTVAGVVEVIDPVVDPVTRSVALEAKVPNEDGRLAPGMAVSLKLVVGEIPEAIVVPREAIVRQGTRHLVYVLDDEDRAVQREVALGQFFTDEVHVRSGVGPGDRVVAAGQQKLRPGSPTAPAPFVPTDNPNLALGRLAPERCEPGA